MKRRFDYDFVRFLAMCMVVLFHISSALVGYNIVSPMTVLYAGKNVTLGQFGVVLFFLVSGATSCMSMRSALKKENARIAGTTGNTAKESAGIAGTTGNTAKESAEIAGTTGNAAKENAIAAGTVGEAAKASGTAYKKATVVYYKKRLLAMMPAFYIAYLVVYFMYGQGSLRGLLQPRMLYTLFGMDGYASIGGYTTCYEIGEWFLGAILLLYLLFPLLYYLIRKYPKQTFAVLILCYILLVRLYPFHVRPMDGNFLVRIFDFSLGIYIGNYFEDKINRKSGIIGAVLMVLIMCVRLPAIYYEFCITLQGIGAFCFLMWIGKCIQNLPGITTKYVQTVASAGSNYCYEVFLVHHIVILHFLIIYSNTAFGLKTWALTTLVIIGLIVFWSIILRLMDKYCKEVCGRYLSPLIHRNTLEERR